VAPGTAGRAAGSAPVTVDARSALDRVLPLREFGIGDDAPVMEIGEFGELEFAAGPARAKGRVPARISRSRRSGIRAPCTPT